MNQFVTGAGGSNAVLLDGVANSLSTAGSDVVLAGGPSTVTATGGGVDAITLAANTTLAFINGSSAPGSFVHNAAGGIVLLAGPGSTQIVPGTGTEYDFVDTSAGNVTISAGPGQNLFTFIKDADASTANITVFLPPAASVGASFPSLGDVVAIHGYTASSITAGGTGIAVLALSDGSQITFDNTSVASLQTMLRMV